MPCHLTTDSLHPWPLTWLDMTSLISNYPGMWLQDRVLATADRFSSFCHCNEPGFVISGYQLIYDWMLIHPVSLCITCTVISCIQVIIARKAGEIIHLVASVRLSVWSCERYSECVQLLRSVSIVVVGCKPSTAKSPMSMKHKIWAL